MNRLSAGRVELEDSSGVLANQAPAAELAASLRVYNPRLYSRVATSGTLGLAEAYLDGDWDCTNLVDLFRMFLREQSALPRPSRLAALTRRPLGWLLRLLPQNRRDRARRNIAAHYDLGNDFFSAWLDETMTYSSGLFLTSDTTLHDASLAKYDRICQKLRLQPDDHVLEIGTGWGGFAIYAAKEYGCRVTTTTISSEQFALAQQRVAAAGLASRVQVRHDDYRDLTGCYDKLVSIEMIEAIGDRNLPVFFRNAERLLRPDGMACLQAITIGDAKFDAYRRTTDFIRRHIFPGGCLPSNAAMLRAAEHHTDFELTHLETFGQHYAETLARWRETFWQRVETLRGQGLDERFLRAWDFYFAYCRAGFLERHIDVAQLLFARGGYRGDAVLGVF